MEVFVHYDSRCIHSERAEEQFGSWSEENQFTLEDVSTKRSNRYCNDQFDVEFDAKPGDTVHVLYMIYGSGDSFGNSSGHGEILWVFKDRLLAEEALKRWQYACDLHGDWRHDNKQQSCTFHVDGGRWIKLSNPVYGYFERLTTLELRAMILQ